MRESGDLQQRTARRRRALAVHKRASDRDWAAEVAAVAE